MMVPSPRDRPCHHVVSSITATAVHRVRLYGTCFYGFCRASELESYMDRYLFVNSDKTYLQGCLSERQQSRIVVPRTADETLRLSKQKCQAATNGSDGPGCLASACLHSTRMHRHVVSWLRHLEHLDSTSMLGRENMTLRLLFPVNDPPRPEWAVEMDSRLYIHIPQGRDRRE